MWFQKLCEGFDPLELYMTSFYIQLLKVMDEKAAEPRMWF